MDTKTKDFIIYVCILFGLLFFTDILIRTF